MEPESTYVHRAQPDHLALGQESHSLVQHTTYVAKSGSELTLISVLAHTGYAGTWVLPCGLADLTRQDGISLD